MEAAKDVDEMAAILKAAFTSRMKTALLIGDEVMSDTTPLIDMGVDSS